MDTNHKKRKLENCNNNDINNDINNEQQQNKKRKLNESDDNKQSQFELIQFKVHRIYENNRALKKLLNEQISKTDHYKQEMSYYKTKYLKLQSQIKQFFGDKNKNNNNNNKEEEEDDDINNSEIEIEIEIDSISSSPSPPPSEYFHKPSTIRNNRRRRRRRRRQSIDTRYDHITSQLIEMQFDPKQITDALSLYYGTGQHPKKVLQQLLDEFLGNNNNELIPSLNDATWDNTHYVDIECHLCSQSFDDDDKYIIHLEECYKSHDDDNVIWLNCEFNGCLQRRIEKWAFMAHLTTHTKKRPYHCNVTQNGIKCDYSGSTRHTLQEHINGIHYDGVNKVSASTKKMNKKQSDTKT